VSNAWAGACIFCGPAWIPPISLDVSHGFDKPTDWWKSIRPEELEWIAPFDPSEAFADTGDSVHDVEQHLKGVFGIAAAEGQHIDPQRWTGALKAIKHSQSPDRNNLLWLAVAPINIFGPHNWLKDGKLSANTITNVWTGACKLSGAAWSNSSEHAPMISSPVSSPSKTKDPTDAPTPKPLPTKTPPTHTSALLSKGVSFDSEAKAAPTETGPKFKGLFLSRRRRQPKPVKVKAKAEKRTHEDGCYTVECPPIDSDWKDAGAELVAHFVFMTVHFFSKDKKSLLHV
jgi:hypothetical protein